MATQPAAIVQNPLAPAGTDPNAELLAKSLANGPTQVGNQTITPPAVVSSGNASTADNNNKSTYNGIQDNIAKNANVQFDPTNGKTWNQATGQYDGPVSPNFKGASGTPPESNSSAKNPATGNPNITAVTNPDGSFTYSPKDPNDTNQVYTAQLMNQNASYQATVKPLLDKVASIANGTYVLTPAEQAQLDAIQNTIKAAVSAQQQVNNFELGANNAWSSSVGGDRYGGNSSDLFRGDLVTRETQRITDIQLKGAATLAAAKQAILDNDAKGLNDAITQYQNFNKQNSDNITKLLGIANDAAIQAHNALQDKIDQQKANTESFKAQMTFNKDNNVTGQFYQYPGSSQVFSAQTGQPVTQAEYLAAGGKADYSSIQTLSNSPQLQSAAGKEYQDYLTTLPQGQKPLSFNDYQNADANRKAKIARSGAAVTYNQAKDQAQTQAASIIGTGLGKKAGPDGYVSPSDYKAALKAWVSDGYSAKDFNSQFANYINPADSNVSSTGVEISDYGNIK